MSPKELPTKTTEQQLPVVITDLISQNRDKVAKRTRRLLDPLDDHNFLSTMGIGELPSAGQAAEREGYFSPKVIERHFYTTAAFAKKHPGRYERFIEGLTEQSIDLISQVAETNQDRIGKNGPSVRSTDSLTPLRRYIITPYATASMDLLNIIIEDELFRVEEGTPQYSPRDQRALLAGAVGLAQAVIVSELEKANYFKNNAHADPELSKKRIRNQKISVRDHILSYAFQRVSGRKDLPEEFRQVMTTAKDVADSFRIEKYLEQQQNERRKDKKALPVHLYTD